MSRILWIDNDPAYLEPYVKALVERNHYVDVITNISGAETAINKCQYDLLILDVMIPTKTEEEEKVYDPVETDRGLRTGLIFYRRNKKQLDKAHAQTLVLTVRLDRVIFDEFCRIGLPSECFMTKLSLREVPIFIKKVADLLGERNSS